MQFMLLVYKNDARFAATPDAEKVRISEACDTWRDQLAATGKVRDMNRLHPSDTAATVRKAGEQMLVTDGPFAETKEVFAGYVILECRDRAEAIELTKTFPAVAGGLTVEVRPVIGGDEERLCWRRT